MVLIDNVNILKAIDNKMWETLKLYENKENRVICNEQETRRGDKTLIISKDDKKVFFHSKYNPLKEAEAIIESYDNIGKDTSVIFYGTGMGYHIKLFLEKYPDIKYYICEPIPELMYYFVSNINLRGLKNSRLRGISMGLDSIETDINKFVNMNRGNMEIIALPSHKQNFPDEYNEFNEMFLKVIKNKRSELGTNYSFQKRWVINSMKNLKVVLSTPNILIEKAKAFKNMPAILVAAGPSLNDEIENLKYIKDNGLAYILSVGSAINTLIHHGIYPDAACTYDPGVHNQKVFETTKEKAIAEIPIIFGSSVGYETLLDYPGQKYHMITSQDTISGYYLKNEDDKSINIVQDAPSIAVITIQLLYQLGFESIILVGQNLGYKGKQRYSEGIPYSLEVTEDEITRGIWIKDVTGEEILTNETFQSMRSQMEQYIKNLTGINVINTTQGGAHIDGTRFVGLEDLIKERLLVKVVEKSWLESTKEGYDTKYLLTQLDKMDKSYAEAIKLIKGYFDILKNIKKLTANRNFKQVEKMYVKLDKSLRRVENNDFFKIFILPMNRVQYKILVEGIDNLNEQKDPTQKGVKIIEVFEKFMDICNQDIKMVDPIYEEMKEDIRVFIIDCEGDYVRS